MRRTFAALIVFVLLGVAPASASPAEVSRNLPNAQMVGEAQYGALSVRLFSAELWAENGRFSWDRPFALAITYNRSTRASALIDRSLREMSGRGAGDARALAPLRAQFERCFTDLNSGNRVTGVSTGANTARFYRNGAKICDVRWPGFRRSFFGIWLAGRDGPAARLSAQLRGEA